MRDSKIRVLSTFALTILLVVLGGVGFVTVVNKVAFQPQPMYTGLPPQKVLLVHESTDGDSRTTYDQVVTSLDYAKIAHEDVDVGEIQFSSLEDYTAIVIATESLSHLGEGDALKIKEYVAGGGGLAVFARARHPVLDEVFGISGRRTPGEVVVSTGIHFAGDLLPGLEGLRIEAQDTGTFESLDVTPLDGVEILATTGDGGLPLVWRHKFGQGRVIYWNNDLLASKAFRGLAVQSVMAVHSGAVMSLVNVGLFHVDGFPAPPPAGPLPQPLPEAERGALDFIYQRWFPDMIGLAHKYGLKYTWLTTFSSSTGSEQSRDERTEPPWDFAEWEEATIEIEGHEVPFCTYVAYQSVRSGHELALQGYNRRPLLLDRAGYTWASSEDDVTAALEAVGQRWQQDSLGPLPVTCVPPDGLYDESGLAVLAAALPSVEVVGSHAFGAFAKGGEREFGPEPWDENLFTIPRWTSGYANQSYTRLLALSELNTFGAWTHYVRLDDVFDSDADTPWRGGMYDQLDELLGWSEEHYPWLRHLTTAEAYPELLNYFDTGATYTFEKAYRVTITFSNHPTYLLLRLNDGRRLDMNSVVNAQIVSYYEGEGYYQYVLRGLAQEVRLGLLIPTTGS